MPSLHAGWDLLVGISIATAGGHRCWSGSSDGSLPVLMAFAVVATAQPLRRRRRRRHRAARWSGSPAPSFLEQRRAGRARPVLAPGRSLGPAGRTVMTLLAIAPPRRQLPRRPARGQPPRRRRDRVRRARPPRPVSRCATSRPPGPLPFLWDRWELASATAPRLGLAGAARGRPAREQVHARPEGPPGRHRPGRRRAPPRSRPPPRRCWSAAATGRPWSTWPSCSFVQPGPLRPQPRRARPRCAGGSRRTAPAPYGVSVHRSLLDETLVERAAPARARS